MPSGRERRTPGTHVTSVGLPGAGGGGHVPRGGAAATLGVPGGWAGGGGRYVGTGTYGGGTGGFALGGPSGGRVGNPVGCGATGARVAGTGRGRRLARASTIVPTQRAGQQRQHGGDAQRRDAASPGRARRGSLRRSAVLDVAVRT